MITGRQIKAARALLGWDQKKLSEKSIVSIASIRRIEPDKDIPSTTAKTLNKIETAFKDAGISFSNEGYRICLEQNILL